MTLWLPLAGCVSWTGLCTPLGWGLIILSTLLPLEAITYGRFGPKSKLLLGCRSLGFPLGFPSWPISKTPSCVPRGVGCLYIVRFLSPLSSDREQLVNVSGEGAGFELALKGQLGRGGRRRGEEEPEAPAPSTPPSPPPSGHPTTSGEAHPQGPQKRRTCRSLLTNRNEGDGAHRASQGWDRGPSLRRPAK